MDNRLVVGVGNIYANEALFRAGIRPTRAANRVSRERLGRLVEAVRETLADGDRQGRQHPCAITSIATAQPGYFQLEYNVYGREGQPCRVAASRFARSGRAASDLLSAARCQT